MMGIREIKEQMGIEDWISIETNNKKFLNYINY